MREEVRRHPLDRDAQGQLRRGAELLPRAGRFRPGPGGLPGAGPEDQGGRGGAGDRLAQRHHGGRLARYARLIEQAGGRPGAQPLRTRPRPRGDRRGGGAPRARGRPGRQGLGEDPRGGEALPFLLLDRELRPPAGRGGGGRPWCSSIASTSRTSMRQMQGSMNLLRCRVPGRTSGPTTSASCRAGTRAEPLRPSSAAGSSGQRADHTREPSGRAPMGRAAVDGVRIRVADDTREPRGRPLRKDRLIEGLKNPTVVRDRTAPLGHRDRPEPAEQGVGAAGDDKSRPALATAWPTPRPGHRPACWRSRVDYSQPPANPARRSPASKAGQRRMMSQIRPVR